MENCEAFDAFLPLQQSPVYADALARLGARPRWLMLDGGRVLAIERGRLRMVLRAPVPGPDSGPTEGARLVRQMARWGGITLITPEVPISGFGLVPLVTPMHHAIWQLGPGLRAGMARNWRNHLGQAERADLRLTRGTAATLDRLIAVEAGQRRERRYQALPAAFTRALPGGALRLWQWRQAGEMQAAMAFVRHGTSASYHLAWGSDQARVAGVHALMLTRAAEALAAEGVRWLDLGSVDGERAPGLARFKLGTGAELRKLGATLLVLP